MRSPHRALRAFGIVFLLGAATVNPPQIFFTQNGTGAVKISLASKLSDTVSSADFCLAANVNDSTDNTVCLQAAIDAAKGRALHIAPGRYVISSALNLTDTNAGYRLIGESRVYSPSTGVVGVTGGTAGGPGTIIRNTNISGGHAFNINTSNTPGEVYIQGVLVKGNSLSGDGFHVVNAQVTLQDVWSLENGGHGILLQSAWSSLLRGCGSIHNQKTGLYIFKQGNSITVTEGAFNGNDVSQTAWANVQLGGTAGLPNWGVNLIGNDIEGGGTPASEYGAIVQFTYGLNLIGNYFEQAATNLLYIDTTSDAFTVQGNFFHDGAVSIISNNGTISNNIVTAVGGSDHRNTSMTADGSNGSNMRIWGNDTRIIPGSPTWTASLTWNGPTYQRREEFSSALPVTGTYGIGDIIWKLNPTQNQPLGWIVTSAGTLGTLNGGTTTGSCTISTNTLTVNSATGLAAKNIITIAGVTGPRTVTDVTGTTVTLLTNCDATVAAAAVAYQATFPAPFGTVGTGTSNVSLVSTTQANLGAPANGTLYYCSDCTTASACTGGGTGAFASRQNSAWKCL